jgi:superfamily II DNA or RNA helicase
MTRAGIERVFRCSWTFDPRAALWRTDAGSYALVRQELAARCYRFEDHLPTPAAVAWPRVALPPLRADQQSAIEAWRRTGRGVIVMPTGTGKTEVALAIMARSAVATLVVAPIRDLMHQWHRRIERGLGYEPGLLGDGRCNVRPVTVTTYDSACLHMERLGDRFGLVVFDECHHLPGRVRSDAARMCAAPLRLGLTATLERANGRHADLESLIGPVVYETSIVDARGKTLADYDVVRIAVHLSAEERCRYDRCCAEVRRHISERKRTNPGFTWRRLCREAHADPAARRALAAWFARQAIEDRAEDKLRVLEDLFRLHAGEPLLVFAGSNAMARDVSLRFLVPCLLNHCPRDERLDAIEGLQAGTYPAIVANRVLDEGVDLPCVKVAVVIGGGNGGRQARQRLGRILRKAGNARAVLYEVVCADTREVDRSRRRRRNDAYVGKRRRSVRRRPSAGGTGLGRH